MQCVSVPARDAERARRLLAGSGLLVKGLKLVRAGSRVLIPVGDGEKAVSVLSREGIEAEVCTSEFPRYRRPSRLSTPVKSYSVYGDVAVFSYTAGIPLEDYVRAARILVEEHGYRAVYLKVGTEGPYRLPSLRLLWGQPGTEVTIKEYGLRIMLDISKAYYNVRLAGERRSVSESVNDGERVLDMFAGVGPFSLHIASLRRASVVAVDINPYAVYYMIANIKLNSRRLKGCITPVRGDSSRLSKILKPVFNRIIMNNPTMTPQFLGEACGISVKNAVIHYYRLHGSCEGAIKEALHEAPSWCGLQVDGCREVLEHSPTKRIYRIDLRRV
ncbi:MAG: class I SAM-dependent methyltransferase family protein [Desulfurococcales archaeon]|nr:class I SAM-dependent methyltransferase family protein [Desulfurococcales archaeon]